MTRHGWDRNLPKLKLYGIAAVGESHKTTYETHIWTLKKHLLTYLVFCRRGAFYRFQTSGCFVSRGRCGTSWHSDVFVTCWKSFCVAGAILLRVQQVPRLPRQTQVDVSKCHACHAKRRYISPSATPTTWNEGGCHQVPCLLRKVPRRHQRLPRQTCVKDGVWKMVCVKDGVRERWCVWKMVCVKDGVCERWCVWKMVCVKDGVCERWCVWKMVCVKDGVWQSCMWQRWCVTKWCVTKWVCDKVVCERWWVTLCVKDGG